MSKPNFPPGWDEERVREVVAHYENQSEDEEFAEIEAAREAEGTIMMAVPAELAPEVRALIARKHGASAHLADFRSPPSPPTERDKP